MNGKRAKLLRYHTRYSIKEERASGRHYDLYYMNPYKKTPTSASYVVKGPRKLYQQWKAKVKWNNSVKPRI